MTLTRIQDSGEGKMISSLHWFPVLERANTRPSTPSLYSATKVEVPIPAFLQAIIIPPSSPYYKKAHPRLERE